MGVATHLGIDIAEYDARIRTFIPDYEEMLARAATAIPARARTIVDLGVGTGALAAYCLQRAPGARVIGIDVDAAMLKLAARRLGDRATLVCGSFLRAPLTACDAVVASLALHHIRTRKGKTRLYHRIRAALRIGGVFVNVDCQPAIDAASAREQHHAWKSHLLHSYTPSQATALLACWSREDVYVPLESEIRLLEKSGFSVRVLWRRDSFAALVGKPR